MRSGSRCSIPLRDAAGLTRIYRRKDDDPGRWHTTRREEATIRIYARVYSFFFVLRLEKFYDPQLSSRVFFKNRCASRARCVTATDAGSARVSFFSHIKSINYEK